MLSNYKYNPEDFKNIMNMSDDLSCFYNAHDAYRKTNQKSDLFELERRWENLFFTLKHREVEGNLNPIIAQDIRTYLEDLMQ